MTGRTQAVLVGQHGLMHIMARGAILYRAMSAMQRFSGIEVVALGALILVDGIVFMHVMTVRAGER